MDDHRTSLTITVVVAVLLVGGCFPPEPLHCVSATYTIVAGTSIPLDNPCATTPGPQALIDKLWLRNDDFSLEALPAWLNVPVDKTRVLPTRQLRVAPNTPTQTVELTFDYSFSLSSAGGDFRFNGSGKLKINILGLNASVTAEPPTIAKGGQSRLDAQPNGLRPPSSYHFAWSPTQSLSKDDFQSPTATPAETTEYHVVVTDDIGNSYEGTVKVTVLPISLLITDDSLPSGTVGQEYSRQLGASPASTSDVWSVTEGALPPGITLDKTGRLSGMPTSAGFFPAFTVQVTDPSTGESTTKNLSIEIDNPAPSITAPVSPQTAQAGTSAFPLRISGTDFVATTTVMFGASSLALDSFTPTQIIVTVPSSVLTQAGSVQVSVKNPVPGGGTSLPLTFQ